MQHSGSVRVVTGYQRRVQWRAHQMSASTGRHGPPGRTRTGTRTQTDALEVFVHDATGQQAAERCRATAAHTADRSAQVCHVLLVLVLVVAVQVNAVQVNGSESLEALVWRRHNRRRRKLRPTRQRQRQWQRQRAVAVGQMQWRMSIEERLRHEARRSERAARVAGRLNAHFVQLAASRREGRGGAGRRREQRVRTVASGSDSRVARLTAATRFPYKQS